MFEKMKIDRTDEFDSDCARIIELTNLELYEDHIYNYLAINEDYYLSEEEVREYFVPGNNLRKYYIVQGEHVMVRGREVYLDGQVIGDLRPSDERAVAHWLDQSLINRMEIFLGGGAFRQIRLSDKTGFDWERDACKRAADTSEKEPDSDRDPRPGERIEIRNRRIPYYAYLYLELEGDQSERAKSTGKPAHYPARIGRRRKPKLQKARARGKKRED